jgi:peptide chain release factor-like protein
LARAISSGSVHGQTILHLKQSENRIQVVASRATPASTAPSKRQKPGRAVANLQQEVDELRQRFAGSEMQVRPLADRKSELLLQTQQPTFYQNATLRTATFDEIHKLDQFLGLWEGLGKALDGLYDRLRSDRINPADESRLRERVEELSAEFDQLAFIARSKNARDLGDALICISLVERTGKKQDAVQKLGEMYQALAKRRRMVAEVLGEFVQEKHDRAYLSIAGLGAYSLLKHETGLHQFDHRSRAKTPRTNREILQQARESIRVEVLPLENQPDKPFRQAIKSKVIALKPVRKRLLDADLAVSLFHEPSLRSLEVWTTGSHKQALERALVILHAQASNGADNADGRSVAIIRHYGLGISPRVRDARTGRSTTRVDRVLKGHLDSLLLSDS